MALNDPETVELLSTKFVPLAQNKHERRPFKDDAEFYEKTLRNDGFYAMTPEGEMLLPDRVMGFTKDGLRRKFQEALAEFDKRLKAGYVPSYTPSAGGKSTPTRYRPPAGAAIVMMRNKVLGYDPKDLTLPAYRYFAKEFMEQTGQMYLVLPKGDVAALAQGKLPLSVKLLIASSLIDPAIEGRWYISALNATQRWAPDDLKDLRMNLKQGRLTGSVRLYKKDGNGEGSYAGEILGFVKASKGKLTRFDVVVKGEALDKFEWRDTQGRNVPKGPFPMAFAFTLIDKDEDLAKIPYQAMYENAAADPNLPHELQWDVNKVPRGIVK